MHSRLLCLAAALTAPGAAGCYTNQCNASTQGYDGGEFVSPEGTLAYQSSTFSSSWVPFPGEATIVVTYPTNISKALANCEAEDPQAWVGTSNEPVDQDSATFTIAGGDLAVFSNMTNKGFSVTNPTCSKGYYAHFLITYAAADGGPCMLSPGTSDASAGD
jgi:hypothetical protein